jgi:hypothetical protein
MSELLLEEGRLINVIRTIVKDLVTIYKEEDEGEFYLPNYLYDDIDNTYTDVVTSNNNTNNTKATTSSSTASISSASQIGRAHV